MIYILETLKWDKNIYNIIISMNNKLNILAVGDSHCRDYFTFISKIGYPNLKVCGVSGGTAYGLKNINSISNTFKKILNFLEKEVNINTNKIIFLIGEGDCGYLAYCNAEKKKISINESLHLSIKHYFDFINIIINKFPILKNKICIMGTILPSIDKTDENDVAGIRYYITNKFTKLFLTEKTLHFNKIIKEKCNELGFSYFDITQYIIKDGLLNKYFKLNNKNDHHLDPSKIYKFIITELSLL